MTLEVDIVHRLGAFRLEARFESDGRLVALFGHSGSGKTSLINLIGGLARPDEGRIVVDGRVLADVEADDGAFTRANLLALRNAAVFNALAGPALNTPGPVALTGMMLAAAPGRDAFTLALAGKLAPLQQSA